MNVHISPVWLSRAWYGRQSFKSKPTCCVSNGQMKITVFRENAVGMRSMTSPVETTPIDSQDACCFEIPDALRAYVHKLQFVSDIRLTIMDDYIEIVAETPSFAIQYRVNNINRVDDVFIHPSEQDIGLEIGTEDWFHICDTMPQNGHITFECRAQKRMITLQHSQKRWGAVIMAKAKAPRAASFTCRTDVVRFCFKAVESLPAFGKLVFMNCGVLRWHAGFTQVYLAPHTDD